MENDPITAPVMKSLRNCIHQEVMRMREILIELHLRKPVMQEKGKRARILRKQAKVRLVKKRSYCTDITNQDITTHKIWHKIYITLWGHGHPIGFWQFLFYSSGFVILVLHYINHMKTILCRQGQLFGVWQFVCFSLSFDILVYIINNMKTILAGNANAFLKNQINNMERKIHGSVHLLYPCKAAFSKLASILLS